MSFLQDLKSHQTGLTPAQRAMARYILENGEQVSFMTAKQLGEATGQSDAAVIRFAQATGYSGFPALREALREDLLGRLGASGLRPDAGPSSEQEVKAEVFGTDASLVQETANLNPDALVSEIVDLLVRARRIYVTAHGTSYALAAYLAMQLNLCFGKASIFTMEHGDIADRMRSIGPEDVFIGIGYVRYLPYTVDIMRSARKSNAQVVAITDHPTSPLASAANHALFVARGVRSPAWWSQAGALALCNWLVALAMHRDPTTAADHLRQSDDQLKQLGHWQGGEEDGLEHLFTQNQKPKQRRAKKAD